MLPEKRRAQRATYRERNREKIRAANAEYYIGNRDRIRTAVAEYNQTLGGKEAKRRSGANQRERAPEKVKARSALNLAVRLGHLVRGPCEHTGDECSGRIEAHHGDYSKQIVRA